MIEEGSSRVGIGEVDLLQTLTSNFCREMIEIQVLVL